MKELLKIAVAMAVGGVWGAVIYEKVNKPNLISLTESQQKLLNEQNEFISKQGKLIQQLKAKNKD